MDCRFAGIVAAIIGALNVAAFAFVHPTRIYGVSRFATATMLFMMAGSAVVRPQRSVIAMNDDIPRLAQLAR